MAVRLLIVEDEFLIRILVADRFLEAGFDVFEAGDGDEAMAALERHETLDMLITDIQMPGKADGNDIALKAILRYPNLPVIYASGRPESLRNTIRSCDAFVPKPFSPDRMLALAMRMLQPNPKQLCR